MTEMWLRSRKINLAIIYRMNSQKKKPEAEKLLKKSYNPGQRY